MIRVIRIATVLASALVLFTGCENLLTGESYAPPTDVEASTGEFRDRIEIEWKAPPARETSDGKTIGVEQYQVYREKWDSGDSEWKDDPIGSANDTTTDTSFTDEWVVPGVAYRYRIVAEFADGSVSDSSEYAEGYALEATRLILYSNETEGERSFDLSGGDAWFEFSAQRGWPYRITVTGGTPGVEIYALGNIRDIVANFPGTGEFSFPAPQTTVYHIRVYGNGTGTISVWY
ncbi:MAG: hypothetical protein EA383_16325 [Spirochaetaceae bacterium]|nr:MAG: hypothetical protein EA383_16325 [Spirochaetaceae bacterium]